MERNPSALSSSPHNGISRKHRGRRAAGSGESATASPRARDQVRQENRRGRGAMSWQAYVDEHLLCDIDGQTSASPPRRRRHPRPRRRCLGAARCLPTGQTRRNHFRPVVMNDFNEPGSLAPTGLYLGGSKYMAIQGKPRVFIREKKDSELCQVESCCH
ncbi:hypothetical protein BDA96_03G038500 [Sorghum bicolor]|uniref:Uncharacterized protein n=2 Tax=Sorghum bicolor TaxID=4558 RepID=A0A1W0VVI9_SORBI|nr:hypothetical protein BDA96_03G038500 [Sorghum bicolor]KAG0536134.1 hypothetical protein BDA96_03G038500 [Sorghum bicolor]KAG0536137.1 hypothetical protein BDA96_03G038500 [Sorghum bicolor]OQU86159.1 hypothetical protein SORBI_3003G035200 [Sorghum bicolor]OQU86160.1 hypothetical protein SORBI_3003G035200 [Sorghum bicolor]